MKKIVLGVLLAVTLTGGIAFYNHAHQQATNHGITPEVMKFKASNHAITPESYRLYYR